MNSSFIIHYLSVIYHLLIYPSISNTLRIYLVPNKTLVSSDSMGTGVWNHKNLCWLLESLNSPPQSLSIPQTPPLEKAGSSKGTKHTVYSTEKLWGSSKLAPFSLPFPFFVFLSPPYLYARAQWIQEANQLRKNPVHEREHCHVETTL